MTEQTKIFIRGGLTKYEEEDWADLISAQIADTKNFACLFTTGLADDDYKNLSLVNGDSGAKHSSDLFRLLHIQKLQKGTIPLQCERALQAKGEKSNFKNCFESL